MREGEKHREKERLREIQNGKRLKRKTWSEKIFKKPEDERPKKIEIKNDKKEEPDRELSLTWSWNTSFLIQAYVFAVS